MASLESGGRTPRSAARASAVPAYDRKNASQPRKIQRVMTAVKPDKPGTLRVSTWNVGSLTGKSGEVARELSSRKVDIACLQETRWRGQGTRKIGEGMKLFWSGGKEALNGVGIVITNKLINKVTEVKRINDRIMILKLVFGSTMLSVVSCYAPQTGLPDHEKIAFYEELDSALNECEEVLVAGDLNGHVGAGRLGFESVHGGSGLDVRNDDGTRILDFALAHQLKVCNTWFRKPESQMITYCSGQDKTQIDYILARQKCVAVKNVKTIPVGTQHKLLVADIVASDTSHKTPKPVPRLRVYKLKDPECRQQFKSELGDLSAVTNWNELRLKLKSTAEKICGFTKTKRTKETWWWTNELEALVKSKKEAFKKWFKEKTHANRQEYVITKNTLKSAVRQAMSLAAEKAIAEADDKKIFAIAKQRAKEQEDVVASNCLRAQDGKLVMDTDKRKNLWRDHFSEIMNVENPFVVDEQPCTEGPCRAFTEEEVLSALNSINSFKAAGPSGINAAMLKEAGECSLRILVNIANDLLFNRKLPDDLQNSSLIPLYKGKGDRLSTNSFRGIKLLEHPFKVLEKLLETRLRKLVTINDQQFGFMPGRGTTDAIFVTRQITEKYIAKGKKLHWIFIDLEKAFDRVPRRVMVEALRHYNVPECLVQAIMTTYNGCRTSVVVDGHLSEPFDVSVGVHQGSILSPLLFIIVMQYVTEDARYNDLLELLYADDIALGDSTVEAVVARYLRWKESMERKGLKVSVKKTKVLSISHRAAPTQTASIDPCGVCRKRVGCNSIRCNECLNWVHKRCSEVRGSLQAVASTFRCPRCTNPPLTVQTEDFGDLESVASFTYLGHCLDQKGGFDGAISQRIQAAWAAFRRLKGSLVGKHALSLRQRGTIYARCVRPVLTYSSETWCLTTTLRQRLVSTERRMLRMMCSVRLDDRLRSEELYSRLHIQRNIVDYVEDNILRWYGHVMRRSEDHPVKKALNLNIGGRNPPGRPRKTWRTTVEEVMTSRRLGDADPTDRDTWRQRIQGRPANLS